MDMVGFTLLAASRLEGAGTTARAIAMASSATAAISFCFPCCHDNPKLCFMSVPFPRFCVVYPISAAWRDSSRTKGVDLELTSHTNGGSGPPARPCKRRKGAPEEGRLLWLDLDGQPQVDPRWVKLPVFEWTLTPESIDLEAWMREAAGVVARVLAISRRAMAATSLRLPCSQDSPNVCFMSVPCLRCGVLCLLSAAALKFSSRNGRFLAELMSVWVPKKRRPGGRASFLVVT